MDLRNHKTVKERRRVLEKEKGVALEHIGNFSFDENIAASRHCENMIGAVQVPMGIAGPLIVKQVTSEKKQEYYIPLATTEGALVASINRGCKAIGLSGGATTDSYRVGVTRGPVFRVKNLAENDRLNTFLENNFEKLQEIAASTSKHLKLTKYFSRGVGRERFVRFVFDTSSAMGMNMATIATTSLVAYIEKQTGAECIALAGNYDVDKKPSWLNIIEGRGIKVWAEAILTEKVLREVLKTSSAGLYDVWLNKCLLGSAMSGSMAFNAQFANVVAALFLATGQDLAHVGEGSLGITTTEIVQKSSQSTVDSSQQEKKDLYVSVYLPDVLVGIVGGGTGLATQREALSIIGAKTSEELAEVLAGTVLAGEISLLASLSEGSLAEAHEKLARGKINF